MKKVSSSLSKPSRKRYIIRWARDSLRKSFFQKVKHRLSSIVQ